MLRIAGLTPKAPSRWIWKLSGCWLRRSARCRSRHTTADHRRERHCGPQTRVGIALYDTEHHPTGRHIELVDEAQGFHGYPGRAAMEKLQGGDLNPVALAMALYEMWMAGICR